MKINNKPGFTIVELLIVIVVIAILVAIATTAYAGIQKRTATSVVQHDLKNASTAMEMAKIESGSDSYPSTLPATIKASGNVSLVMKNVGTSVYSGLSTVQNGVLFYDTCQALLAEGVGDKPDDNHDYFSACTVYNKNQIHVDGWNGRDIGTPLTTTSLQTYINSYVGGSVPEFKTHAQTFMDQLASRFTASGGQFPVTSFWDNWATPMNGGVVKPTLPAPTSVASAGGFCIEATYNSYANMHWHTTDSHALIEGAC